MLIKHDFFAMASSCEICLDGIDADQATDVATRAEAEVVRIERKFSRYRNDRDLSRINRAAQVGATVDVDTEVFGLLAYAGLAYRESDALFDISSGILREVWDFKAGRLPGPDAIAAVIPHIGFDKVRLGEGRLDFAVSGMELDFGGLGKEYASDRAAEICLEAGVSSGFATGRRRG